MRQRENSATHKNYSIVRGVRKKFTVRSTVKLIVESTNIGNRRVEAYCDLVSCENQINIKATFNERC